LYLQTTSAFTYECYGTVFETLLLLILGVMSDLWSLDREALASLQKQEEEKLMQQLLAGVAWEDTAAQRERIAEVANVLYKKKNPGAFSDPASTAMRNHE
jgi:hypothetical protein